MTNSGSRRGPWDFSAKYDYLTAQPWSKEDSERANEELMDMNLT